MRAMILGFFPQERRNEANVETLASNLQDFIFAADLGRRLEAFIDLREWTKAGAINCW